MQSLTVYSAGKIGGKKILVSREMRMRNETTFVNGNWARSNKPPMHLSFDLVIPILGMSPNGTLAKILKVVCKTHYSLQ